MVRAGYKQTEVGVIPDDWEAKPLGDQLTLQRGFDLPSRLRREGNVPIVSSSGVTASHDDARVSAPGIVTGRYGTVGQVFFIEQDFWPLNTTLYVKDFNGNDPLYLAYLLRTVDFASHSGKSGVPGINRNDIHELPTAVPLLPEQRAIASALSDVDGLLGALDRLIAKKRDLKQAAMQQLLTGQTRLPGFAGEWGKTSVGANILRWFCGPSPTCEERNIEGADEWGVLKTTAMTWENGWDWTQHKTLPKSYWNQPDLELREGDVLVTKAGPRHRVGVTACVDYVPDRIIPSGKMIALRPDPDKAVPLMLSAAIASPEAQSFMDQRTTGMAESQVNYENNVLLDTPIKLPDFEEQSAIAKVLGDIDAELAALEQRRDKTRAIKQGMMQELLTGRARLVNPDGSLKGTQACSTTA